MSMRRASLLALALLGVGSCASADTIYERRDFVQPYYGSVTPVYPANVNWGPVYVPNSYAYSYGYDPSAAGLVDRSAKTGIGVSAKAAKEVFKAIF